MAAGEVAGIQFVEERTLHQGKWRRSFTPGDGYSAKAQQILKDLACAIFESPTYRTGLVDDYLARSGMDPEAVRVRLRAMAAEATQ
jgi:hypothetical protein